MPGATDGVVAIVDVQPIGDNKANGSLQIVQTPTGIEISGRLMELAAGQHGFHVHENADCDDPGVHFAPDGNPHGDPKKGAHHLGDLGNIEAGAANEAIVYLEVDGPRLEGEQSLIDRVLVVHSGADDLKTQPSGNSGDPIACGVIEAADAGGASEADPSKSPTTS